MRRLVASLRPEQPTVTTRDIVLAVLGDPEVDACLQLLRYDVSQNIETGAHFVNVDLTPAIEGIVEATVRLSNGLEVTDAR